MTKGTAEPKILVLFSAPLVDPKGEPLAVLDFDTEKKFILERLRDGGIAGEIRFEIATTDNLRRYTLQGYNILHYSGHGSPEDPGKGYVHTLAFEDGRGGTHPLNPDLIRDFMSAGGGTHVKLAVVSACHSRPSGEALAAAGIPHVVAIRAETPVADHVAITFARDFYAALGAGKTVREAFDIGVEGVSGHPGGHRYARQADRFLLLGEGDHQRDRLFAARKGQLWDRTPPPAPAQGLPAKTDVVGRSCEIKEVVENLLDHRLVTITGFPGIGKSTVAAEAARWLHQRHHFPEGVFFVALAAVTSAGALRTKMAAALELAECPHDSDLAQALKGKAALFVLDNLEDLLAADRGGAWDLLNAVLKGTEGVKFLSSSQEEIGGVLHSPEKPLSLDRLSEVDAALLFLQEARGRIALGKRELESAEFSDIMEFLGGHPLSIRLTAAQLGKAFGLGELRDALRKLGAEAVDQGIPRELRGRFTSLMASMSLAYGRLVLESREAATLFLLVSLFPGGATEQALDQVLEFPWREPMRIAVSKSLVDRDPLGRYYLLPPLRSYGERRLRAEGSEHYLKYVEKGAEFYAALAAYLHGAVGREEGALPLAILSLEEVNMASFLERGMEDGAGKKAQEAAVAISIPLSWLLDFAGRSQRGMAVARDGLKAARRIGDRLGEANTLKSLGDLEMRVDRLEEARQRYQEALPIYRDIGARLGEANTLQSLGDLEMRVARLEEARQRYQEALPIYRDIGDRLGEANTLRSMGLLDLREGHGQQGEANIVAALELFGHIEDRFSSAQTLQLLAHVFRDAGQKETACKALRQAQELFRSIQDEARARECARLAAEWGCD